MSTPSPEALFAIARAINVAAQIEVEAWHIPPSNNGVACVCDDDGSLDSPTSERHGELRLTLNIERWSEGTKTYTEGGRAELNAEAAAVARIRDFAKQYGRLGVVGDGSGEYGAQTCYELAEYFDRLPTTRFTPETAVDWMNDHADLNSGAGCLSGDEIEEVEHVFAALSDARRRPSESERQAFRLFGEEQPFVCPVHGVDYRLEIIGRNELGAIIARP